MSGIGDMSGRVDHRTFDALLELEDGAAAITSSGAGSDIRNLGTGFVQGVIRADVSACKVSAGDENYRVGVQLSTESDFATFVGDESQALELGDATTLEGNRDLGAGQYMIRCSNEVDGVVYPYIRLFLTIAGTSPSITLKAYLGKEPA